MNRMHCLVAIDSIDIDSVDPIGPIRSVHSVKSIGTGICSEHHKVIWNLLICRRGGTALMMMEIGFHFR